VHASAGNPFRRWPAAAFIELIVRLAATDHRRRILVSSGPSEPQAAHAIVGAARGRLGAGGAAVLLGAEVDLATLRELIARAALFIGGDSGPLHIAATTTTPIVALFGPTLPEHSGPWRDPSLPQALIDGGPLPCRPCDQRRCLPGDFRCLTGIEVESVVAAAERLLRHHDDSLAPNSTPVENSY
jgi:ADP-heptose:LPS heptosyltransferase